MDVDQPGGHDPATLHLEHLRAVDRKVLADSRDLPVLDQDVEHAIAAVGRVDHPAALQQSAFITVRLQCSSSAPSASRPEQQVQHRHSHRDAVGHLGSGSPNTGRPPLRSRFRRRDSSARDASRSRPARPGACAPAVRPNSVKYSRTDGMKCAVHALVLDAQHHHDVGAVDGFVHRRRRAHAEPLESGGHQASPGRTPRRRPPSYSAAGRSTAARGCGAGRRRWRPSARRAGLCARGW